MINQDSVQNRGQQLIFKSNSAANKSWPKNATPTTKRLARELGRVVDVSKAVAVIESEELLVVFGRQALSVLQFR